MAALTWSNRTLLILLMARLDLGAWAEVVVPEPNIPQIRKDVLATLTGRNPQPIAARDAKFARLFEEWVFDQVMTPRHLRGAMQMTISFLRQERHGIDSLKLTVPHLVQLISHWITEDDG